MDRLETTIKQIVKDKVKTVEDLARAKRKVSKQYKIGCPSNISLLKTYHEMVKNKRIKQSSKIEILLIKRPVRSLSGIVNISVLTKPYLCPGKCIYCPTEKGIPKSYVSGEPAVERAKRLNYDPYLQVQKRIEMLESEGHPTDKIELRIVGGTWSFYPKTYQSQFLKKCFDACNEKTSKNLKQAQKTNEKAKHRIIGLSIETRPDFITKKEIKRLRNLGATMVELGIQSIYNDVLKLNLRGHTIKETIETTKLLKNAGFKILYQMMPNLLGSNIRKDKEMFKELFENQNFQPDLLKIYPCALLKSAPLYNLWKKKKYKPYTAKQLINLIKEIKIQLPDYVRIQRIARDIPSSKIEAGPAKISNLRQLLEQQSKREGWKCNCIRCREVKERFDPKEKLYLFREEYKASDGKEIFLTFEDKKKEKLYSLLKLRIPDSKKHYIPALKNAAILRELHTYGKQLPIGKNIQKSPQHKGLGKKLIKEAERITKKEGKLNKIAVISGIGVRGYYRKLGYKLKDTYMVKNI